MLDAHFVLLGAAIQVLGSSRYVIAVLRGQAVPHRLTWLLWGVAPLVGFSAELSKGVGLRSLMTLLVGVSPLAVLTASVASRHAGRWRMTTFDGVCGALSVVGLILWRATGDGNVAIALSLTADALAAAPTVRKAFRAPETESAAVYLCAAVSAVITLLTLRRLTFADAAWPGYVLCLGALLFALVRIPRTPPLATEPADG